MLNTSIHSAQPLVSATLGGGLAAVGTRTVPLVVSSPDWVSGLANVREMKVWGDIDPGFLPESISATEGDSSWVPFVGVMTIVLSAGEGEKVVGVRLRNYSGVTSDAVECTTTLSGAPHASVLWDDGRLITAPDGGRSFGWSSSHDWTRMAIALCPTDDAAFEDCSVVSYDNSGGVAGAHVFGTLLASDILAVDPYPGRSGVRLIRLFVEVDGAWWGAPFRWGAE